MAVTFQGGEQEEVVVVKPDRFEVLLADPDWVLAHFTLAADLTALREECRFARSGEAVVARYQGLPFAALAFLEESSEGQIADLAAQLISPGEVFYLLLNERQAALAERAFIVEQVHPEWQMFFAGDPAALDPGDAVPLGPYDLDQMQNLAGDAGLMALEADPFRHGPAFGIWEGERLVAMGSTHLRVPGAAEIGNVATRTTHRRRGLAQQVVAALVQAHVTEGRRVFLMVFQSNHAAVQLYQSLGFVRLRPMFLMRCRLLGRGQ
jgi:ribosomal protein S18 acetylase RimI-like enzyme